MKKRWPLYVVFGVVFYLLFLVVEMPASWFAWGIYKYSHGAVRLDPITGGLWHGNGRLVVYYPRTTPHDLGNTEWRINPLWLFTGKIQTNWRTDAPDMRINTTLRLSPGKVTLLDTEAAFPARTAGVFYPAASLISPQGQVRLNIPELTMDHNGLTGGGDVLWQNAGSSLTTVEPLGDYRLDINGAGKTVNLKLSTLRGALALTGQGSWQVASRHLQFNGYADPKDQSADLAPLLKLFGNDQGNGRRRLTFNGQLP